MFVLLQVLSVLLVAIAMALAVAHALELPGRLRLDRDHPGFTVAGLVSEAGGAGATLLLVLATPADSASLVWTVAAFLSLTAMHGAYWTIAHPANQAWFVRASVPTIAPVGFFASHPSPRPPIAATSGSRLRSRWEYAQIVRAVLAAISLLALATGLAVD